jgi:hypothetical protein
MVVPNLLPASESIPFSSFKQQQNACGFLVASAFSISHHPRREPLAQRARADNRYFLQLNADRHDAAFSDAT